MSDLAKLARRIPAAYIEKAPQGKYGDFVAHHVVTQVLLAYTGPFSLECAQILRGYVPEQVKKKGKPDQYTLPPIESAVVGAVVRLTVTIDGRTVVIEEAGDCEDPHNWPTDGARLKDAMSDGIKRCAMRVGVALHLWSAEHYFLDAVLARDATDSPQGGSDRPGPPSQDTTASDGHGVPNGPSGEGVSAPSPLPLDENGWALDPKEATT